MLPYLTKRLLAIIPVVIAVTVLIFLIIHLVPGDPALVVGGYIASGEDLAQIRKNMGLDRPIYQQYLIWIRNISRGDFGKSLITRRPVAPQLIAGYRNTLVLAMMATLVAVLVGIPLGVISAVSRNSITDHVSRLASLLAVSMPSFWIGLMLIWLFAVKLRLFPVAGMGTVAHFFLPTITLALRSLALITRTTRSSLLETLAEDYIRTARAKGCWERSVIYRHALRNALVPIVTVIGYQSGHLLAGTVVTETVFVWPGLGRLVADAIFQRDFPLVQGGILLIAVTYAIVNLATDFIYGFINPRIRFT